MSQIQGGKKIAIAIKIEVKIVWAPVVFCQPLTEDSVLGFNRDP